MTPPNIHSMLQHHMNISLGQVMTHTHNSTQIDMHIAIQGFKDKELKPLPTRQQIFDDVVSVVSTFFGVTVEKMKEKVRKHNVVVCRQLCMYFMKNYSPKSTLKEIGDYFGGFDHTTVIHSRIAVENLIATDGDYKKDFELLSEQIKKHLS